MSYATPSASTKSVDPMTTQAFLDWSSYVALGVF
jgi:hypothetical protein